MKPGMAPRVMLYQRNSNRALQLGNRNMNGLVSVASTILDDYRVHACKSRLQGLLDIIQASFRMTVFIRAVSLYPRHVFPKPVQRLLDDCGQVLAHLVAAIGVWVNVQKYLHLKFFGVCDWAIG